MTITITYINSQPYILENIKELFTGNNMRLKIPNSYQGSGKILNSYQGSGKIPNSYQGSGKIPNSYQGSGKIPREWEDPQ